MPSSIMENAQDWIANWPEGLIALDDSACGLVVSSRATEILGWTIEEIGGAHIHNFLCVNSRGYVHSIEDCPLCMPAESLQIQSGVWQSKQGYNIGVDFRLLPMSGCGNVCHILSFQSNLEAVHSYNELEKYAEYVDKNPEPIAEFDDQGQMVFGNSAMQEQLLNNGFSDLGEPLIFPENIAQICQKCWESQEVIRNIEVHVNNEWHRWQFHPMETSGHISVMGYAFNITEQKNMELRIEAEKAEARRDFFAKMVHELRTPLNAIIGFSTVLIRRAETVLEDKEMRHLKSIRSAGLQLNEMISDTLDISKIEAGMMTLELDTFTVLSVFESFNDQIQTLADAKHLSYFVHGDMSLEIESDPKKVRQILVNLISNAIKYTPAGSVNVHVSLAQNHELGRLFKVDVVDTGIGIPEEAIESLFKAYKQVSEARNRGIQGTGLGLTLVSELTAMLNGRIDIHSVVGEGTTFSLYLPIQM